MYARYNEECRRESDINEHLPVLQKYARECSSIAECGVRGVVSTWAFLTGLRESQQNNKKLFCVDIEHVDMDVPKEIAADHGIDLVFLQENSATVDFGQNVDLLFIDTYHVYGHLKRELAHHHSKVNKYIIMHDTTIDEILGETVRIMYTYRPDLSPQVMAEQTGYPVLEIIKGLGPAIKEFLAEHPEWKLLEKLTNSSGMTVLTRVDTCQESSGPSLESPQTPPLDTS